jgi:hypothetical protein
LRKLRAVLVAAPPLLADLIRQVLTSRLGALIIAEVADTDRAAETLLDLASGRKRKATIRFTVRGSSA